MSLPLDPQVHVEWMVAPAEDADAAWQHVDCCAALHAPIDPLPPAAEIDDEWWPGRCIPSHELPAR